MNQPVHRRRDDQLRRVRGVGRAVHAGRGRAHHRRPGRRDPRRRARVRAGRPGDDLLDARHHRAPRRRRQRPVADQPGAAVRPRRPLRLGPEPAARAEQRAGRRRHGRDPEQADRLPGHRARRRGARAVRGRLGLHDRAALRLAPDADVPRHGARRAAHAVRDRREPGAVRGRRAAHPPAAARARLPGRAGHLPDEDGRAGRRRAALRRVVVRGRGHRHQLRAPRAAHAQGARAAGRGPRRHVDPERDRQAARPRLGRSDGRAGLGRGALAVADARRHAVRPAGGARRHPVAVPGRGPSRLADPARAALARPGRGAAGAVHGRRAPAAVRVGRRRVPAAAHHRPPARVVQHRRPDEPLHARRCTAASRSTCRPRTPTACSSRRARSSASPRAADPSTRRCTSTGRCGRASAS